MINDIPASKQYAFSPLKSLQDKTTRKKIIKIGGKGLMREVSELIEDEKVVIVSATIDRCLFFVDFTVDECLDILNRAKASYDDKLRKAISGTQNHETA